MINGLLGRINESLHISKHFVLNVQQHTSERRVVDVHTNAFFYYYTRFLAAVCTVCVCVFVYFGWPKLCQCDWIYTQMENMIKHLNNNYVTMLDCRHS